MPSIRFLHTSDLHLGKRFGRFAEETRMALLQARQEILARLAKLAQAHDATHVLIAGDMFDTETPSDRVQRHALAAMGAAPELQWWIIPGNHDSGAAEPLCELALDQPMIAIFVDQSFFGFYTQRTFRAFQEPSFL